jgi:hypothetical protein
MNDVRETGAPISHGICNRCVEHALMKGLPLSVRRRAGEPLGRPPARRIVEPDGS